MYLCKTYNKLLSHEIVGFISDFVVLDLFHLLLKAPTRQLHDLLTFE